MRLLLLATTTGYQTRSFAEAARRLGMDVVLGTDRCHVLEDPWQDASLALRFENPVYSTRLITEFAASYPISAVVAVGDKPTVTAATAAQALALPWHPPEAAVACHVKFRQRELFRDAGLNVPEFNCYQVRDGAQAALADWQSRASRLPAVSDEPGAAIADCGLRIADFKQAEAVADDYRSPSHSSSLLTPPLRESAIRPFEIRNPQSAIRNSYLWGFPCVLKPVSLSGSRGVIRANDPDEFLAAFRRIAAMLLTRELQIRKEPAIEQILVESYIPGAEFAVEGLMSRGKLRVLAIFDKPDPLEGPYFEETIYVTPSRLPAGARQSVEQCVADAVRALGLYHGPLHAELRLNQRGAWLLEVAARPIGGLCSRALRFVQSSTGTLQRGRAGGHWSAGVLARHPDGYPSGLGPRASSPAPCENMTLEELVIRNAASLWSAGGTPALHTADSIKREHCASGVMMIPVPAAGVFEAIEGEEAARAVPCIEEVLITAKLGQKLVRWPEASSYPGFLFARGPSPEAVERALREAHRRLRFVIAPNLPVV